MAAITICSDFGAQKNKVWHGFHCLSIYFPWSDGTRCHYTEMLKRQHFSQGHDVWICLVELPGKVAFSLLKFKVFCRPAWSFRVKWGTFSLNVSREFLPSLPFMPQWNGNHLLSGYILGYTNILLQLQQLGLNIIPHYLAQFFFFEFFTPWVLVT